MLPSEMMSWQPEFTDKTLSRKHGAVQLRCLISCGLQQHPPLNRQHRLFRVKRVRRYFQPGNLGSALAGISLLFVEGVISCSCEWSYRDNDWVERLGTPFFLCKFHRLKRCKTFTFAGVFLLTDS